MKTVKFKITVCIILLFLTLPILSMAYKSDKDYPVHQHIAKEAINIWNQTPNEILSHAENAINDTLADNVINPVKYEEGKDIITGSGEANTSLSDDEEMIGVVIS